MKVTILKNERFRRFFSPNSVHCSAERFLCGGGGGGVFCRRIIFFCNFYNRKQGSARCIVVFFPWRRMSALILCLVWGMYPSHAIWTIWSLSLLGRADSIAANVISIIRKIFPGKRGEESPAKIGEFREMCGEIFCARSETVKRPQLTNVPNAKTLSTRNCSSIYYTQ